MASALTFYSDTTKNGDEFLSNNIQVTGDETWVPFVIVETK
jgi:hypothetical protein